MLIALGSPARMGQDSGGLRPRASADEPFSASAWSMAFIAAFRSHGSMRADDEARPSRASPHRRPAGFERRPRRVHQPRRSLSASCKPAPEIALLIAPRPQAGVRPPHSPAEARAIVEATGSAFSGVARHRELCAWEEGAQIEIVGRRGSPGACAWERSISTPGAGSARSAPTTLKVISSWSSKMSSSGPS